MQNTVQIVFILFLLSLIVERIVGFLKEHFPALYKKMTDADEERKRKLRIFYLNIAISCLISLACNADAFYILKNGQIAFWEKLPAGVLAWAGKIIGCIITAFFISNGSKVLHDFLDILLLSKFMKQVLVSKDFNEYLKSADAFKEQIGGNPTNPEQNMEFEQNAQDENTEIL